MEEASESRSSVSFTFQKKALPPKGKPPPQEDEATRDFVLSLTGNKIERCVK